MRKGNIASFVLIFSCILLTSCGTLGYRLALPMDSGVSLHQQNTTPIYPATVQGYQFVISDTPNSVLDEFVDMLKCFWAIGLPVDAAVDTGLMPLDLFVYYVLLDDGPKDEVSK